MIRSSLIAAAVLACAASGHAQTPELDLARIQTLEMQLDMARRQAMEAEREAYAARDRLRTELTLNDMQAAREAAAPPPADPLVAPPAATPTDRALAALAEQHASDSDRLLQLQQEALARSNARILAVQPAL